VLIASIALLGIVVVAAEGRPLEGPTSSARLDVGTVWRDLLVAAFALALLAGAVLVVWSLLASRRRLRPAPRPRRHQWLVTVVALLVMFLAYLVLRPNLDVDDDLTAGAESPAVSVARSTSSSSPPPWAVLTLGGVVAAALAGAVVAARRLGPPEAGPSDPDADPLLEALDASIEDLESEGDPRSAVIAAYARLLDGFERCGLGRRPAETPLEHLRRGLAALPLRPEPAERLTELFLEARFSPHPIGPADRDEAHAALLTARRDLAATATAG
jgi:hypothetical protein